MMLNRAAHVAEHAEILEADEGAMNAQTKPRDLRPM